MLIEGFDRHAKFLYGKITGMLVCRYYCVIKFNILKRLLLIVYCFSHLQVFGQIAFSRVHTFSVTDGNTLPLAWAGGLNSIQFNAMDVDGDGKTDWVLYDRTTNAIKIFCKKESYQYAPEYESVFPESISNFLLIRDFDNDGRPDLFTGSSLGIKVFKNISTEGNTAQFQEVTFYNPPSPFRSEVILSQGFSGKINIQLQFDDIPAIHDIDGDGDLDILVMAFSGSGQIEWHKNLSNELYNKPDSLEFTRVTQSWGQFRECGCGVFAFENQPCPANTRTQHAGGKALLVQDVNADGQADLIFSESACDKVYLSLNQQTTGNALFISAEEFPLNANPNGLYPVAFALDADNDQIEDLLISNGVFARSDTETDFSMSTTQVINNGDVQDWQLATPQPFFLHAQQIDVGDNSVPVFFDADGDGDHDILVSEMGRQVIGQNSLAAGIFWYENLGTDALPAYQLKSDNFANLRILKNYNLKIQFADVTADFIPDLVFSATNTQNQTKIYFIENTAANGFLGGEVVETTIPILFNENFHVADVNPSLKAEILLGKSTGAIHLYTQTGSNTWQLFSTAFRNLGPTLNYTNPSILVADVNNNGQQDLVLGTPSGKLLFFENITEQTSLVNPETAWLLNDANGRYEAPNLGGRVWISARTSNQHVFLIAGSTSGGLQYFKSISGAESFAIYPNPMEVGKKFILETNKNGTLYFSDNLGRTVWQTQAEKGKQEITVPYLQAGVYVVTFASGSAKFKSRIIVR
jgi:hypothetical protein